MPLKRIFGYIGFLISFPIAYYFAYYSIGMSGSVGIGMVGLDIIIYAFLIIVAVTTVFYIIGRVIENTQHGK